MRAQLDEQCLINANLQFWQQMLAIHLDPRPDGEGFSLREGYLAASVNLAGAWAGTIEVRMAERLAYHATAAMMLTPEESVGESDVLDATREIANMIAGGIKPSLPRPCTMTVPQSSVEAVAFRNGGQDPDSISVCFSHIEGEMIVRVVEGRHFQRP